MPDAPTRKPGKYGPPEPRAPEEPVLVPGQILAQTNVIGPDGELVERFHVIPDTWPADLIESLISGGAARRVEGEQ